jgi:hypothetical protein
MEKEWVLQIIKDIDNAIKSYDGVTDIYKTSDLILLFFGKKYDGHFEIYQHPKGENSIIVKKYIYSKKADIYRKMSFSELGINSLSELSLRLILDTNQYVRKLTGESIETKYVLLNGIWDDGCDNPLIDCKSWFTYKIVYYGLFVDYVRKEVIHKEKIFDLIIIKFDDKLEIVFRNKYTNELHIFSISQKENGNGYIIEKDGEAVDINIEGLGVNNVCDLVLKVFGCPKKVAEKLLNREVCINGVIFVNKSKSLKYGFNNCKILNDFNVEFNKYVEGGERLYLDNEYILTDKDYKLVIEKSKDKIVMYIENDPSKRKWVIEQGTESDSKFILTFIRNNDEIISIADSYLNYKSNNMEELFKKIIMNPKEMIYELTHVLVRIGVVEVRENSN